jgi:hypothetical protein
MKRLFVVGCSHTRYVWPSYADILSTEYDYYENWGAPGIGNHAIFHKINEILDTRNLTENDTLIVQWTYPYRFDFHKSPNGWYQGGNITFANDEVQSTILKYAFDENSYEMYTQNYIKSIYGNLQTCKASVWYTTSMPHEYTVDDWLPSLTVMDSSEYKKRRFLNANPNQKNQVVQDAHYTPIMHLEYLEKYTDFTITKKMLQYVNTAEEILDNVKDWTQIQPLMTEAGLLDGFVHGRI